MIKHKKDSIKELKNKKKTVEELAKENEALKEQNKQLSKEITDVQLALVEITSMVVGG